MTGKKNNLQFQSPLLSFFFIDMHSASSEAGFLTGKKKNKRRVFSKGDSHSPSFQSATKLERAFIPFPERGKQLDAGDGLSI